MLTELSSGNDDYDLTIQQDVLIHTPSTSHPMRCIGVIECGDGVKDLSANGTQLELSIQIGEQTLEPDPTVYERSAATRVVIETIPFVVRANQQVTLKLKSDSGDDNDVDVTAFLVDAGDTERHLSKAMLTNKKAKTITTGVLVIKDDDGATTLRTLTPSEADGVKTVTPS